MSLRGLPRPSGLMPGMQHLEGVDWADGIAFVSHGLRIGIRVDRPEIVSRVLACLPPGWQEAESLLVDQLYSIEGRPECRLHAGGTLVEESEDLDHLLHVLESELQGYVAEWASDLVFVHCGVVGWHGKALVISGRSFSGKSTLVSALLRAGAIYYSDEYAVLDRAGRVHPFPRRLALRGATPGLPIRRSPEEFGSIPGREPLPMGLVVLARYEEGARWEPSLLSPGQATLELMDHTICARRRPEASLSAIRQAVRHAVVCKGLRGDAYETARALLTRMAG